MTHDTYHCFRSADLSDLICSFMSQPFFTVGTSGNSNPVGAGGATGTNGVATPPPPPPLALLTTDVIFRTARLLESIQHHLPPTDTNQKQPDTTENRTNRLLPPTTHMHTHHTLRIVYCTGQSYTALLDAHASGLLALFSSMTCAIESATSLPQLFDFLQRHSTFGWSFLPFLFGLRLNALYHLCSID